MSAFQLIQEEFPSKLVSTQSCIIECQNFTPKRGFVSKFTVPYSVEISKKFMKGTSIKSKNKDLKIKSLREIAVLRPIIKRKPIL